jgi:hypothetical protein
MSELAQPAVGRAGHVGQQGQRRVGVVAQSSLNRGFVELTDLR